MKYSLIKKIIFISLVSLFSSVIYASNIECTSDQECSVGKNDTFFFKFANNTQTRFNCSIMNGGSGIGVFNIHPFISGLGTREIPGIHGIRGNLILSEIKLGKFQKIFTVTSTRPADNPYKAILKCKQVPSS